MFKESNISVQVLYNVQLYLYVAGVILLVHMYTCIFQGGVHTCGTCGEGFHQSRHLRRHQLLIHNQVPDYTCQLCAETFSQAKDLRNHLQQVTGVWIK